MAKVTIKQRGGDKLNRLFREAMKGGVKNVKVGFFSEARYEDGTPVAAVAAWNEFGTKPHTIAAKPGKALAFTGSGGETVFLRQVNHPGIPERPFFRSALEEAKPKVIQTLKAEIDPKKMTVGPQLAGRIGDEVAGEVQESITRWSTPPNAPSTTRKKGSSNPLIDTGVMRGSVTWEVER